jgi:hypothetical protein
MTKPFTNHGKDKLTCRYCGETVLPGEAHCCENMVKGEQEQEPRSHAKNKEKLK